MLFPAGAAGHVGLDAPNGGEVLTAGSTFTIEWRILIPHGPSTFDLSLSTDGGTTWEPIVTGLPYEARTYDWTVPELDSDQCLVEVLMITDEGPDYSDVSDGPFTIQTGALLLEDPDPGMAGTVNTFTVVNADPGERVFFVYGFQQGSTPVPGCSGASVDLVDPMLAGSSIADMDGTASFTSFVPGAASGLTVGIQAVEWSSCTVSNLVVFTFP
jgi:hypothetical protein